MLDDTCRYMTSRFTAGGVHYRTEKAETGKNRKETTGGGRVARKGKIVCRRGRQAALVPAFCLS